MVKKRKKEKGKIKTGGRQRDCGKGDREKKSRKGEKDGENEGDCRRREDSHKEEG